MKIHSVENANDPTAKYYTFYCPACKCAHMFKVPPWSFNGDQINNPTVHASILVTATEMTPKGWQDYNQWTSSNYPNRNGKPFDTSPTRCHSFITNGIISYCDDSSHTLKGQSLPLPEFEEL